jgi:alkylation response protein AidB-like acyl-CoA dehydrogenase
VQFSLSPEQQGLLDAIQPLLAKHRDLPQAHRKQRSYYDQALDQALSEGGFFDIAREADYGPLEAALVVDAIGRLPATVECAASMLVAPKLLPAGSPRPVALISGGLDKPQRYLPMARLALVEAEGEVLAIDVAEGEVETLDSLFAYPMGKFRRRPDLSKARRLGAAAVPTLHQWWRVALAVEAGAAMTAAVEFTVDYVKNRRLFNRALGSFQAVQHRLAECHMHARATRFLALRAAWSGDPLDASVAAAYAQNHMNKVRFDLQQFNGGMGMSNEHLLHYWTYRFRALEGEMGGPAANAAEAARQAYAA